MDDVDLNLGSLRISVRYIKSLNLYSLEFFRIFGWHLSFMLFWEQKGSKDLTAPCLLFNYQKIWGPTRTIRLNRYGLMNFGERI